MILLESDEPHLKKWIVKRLEDVSDADPDVLADYILALIKNDATEEEVQKTCQEQLEDFLKENTPKFVDDVFNAIRLKSYLPGYAPPQAIPIPTKPAFSPPSGPSHGQPSGRGEPQIARGGRESSNRKRAYNDREGAGPGDGREGNFNRNGAGERVIKQPRRGGNAWIGGSTQAHGHESNTGGMPRTQQMPGFPNMPMMPTPPPGFPFDPSNPMEAIMAMQAMGFPPLPGMPALPQMGSPPVFDQQASTQRAVPANGQARKRPGQRCRDYDTKGFCARGSQCPYEHGSDHVVVPGAQQTSNDVEYDPKDSSFMNVDKSPNANVPSGQVPLSSSERGGNRGRGRSDRGGPRGGGPPNRNSRATFSHAGLNQDRSVTSIVVEQIPEEKFSEEAVKEFFSEFGTIVEVQMQAYKRLAIVKYQDWGSAQRAYNSPKVIFDNRFVKVYWYKPETLPTQAGANGTSVPGATGKERTSVSEIPEIDMEEFTKKQEEVQKLQEEKRKKREDADSARKDLEKRQQELAAKQAEETKKLMEKLRKSKISTTDSASPPLLAKEDPSLTAGVQVKQSDGDSKVTPQQEALRAQLAKLEAEAMSLGLNTALPDDNYDPSRGRGRGRGTYRGRATPYVPRGTYRGRGGSAGSRGGFGAFKLDNRTKRVAVSGVEFDGGKDESLRQYLLGIGEFSSIEQNPDKKDSQIITFKDRHTAEKLLYGFNDIPGVGKVEMSWVQTPLPPVSLSPASTGGVGKQQNSNTGQSDGDAMALEADPAPGKEDYDVADDDDRWMVE